MRIALSLVLAAVPCLAFAAPSFVPDAAQLRDALSQASGGPVGRINNLSCAPSTPGYVRCTYMEALPRGYVRQAVLVSPHAGHWTVSEGPILERPKVVRAPR